MTLFENCQKNQIQIGMSFQKSTKIASEQTKNQHCKIKYLQILDKYLIVAHLKKSLFKLIEKSNGNYIGCKYIGTFKFIVVPSIEIFHVYFF